MARGFGATRGVGATDNIVPAINTRTDTRSYAFWLKRFSDGGGGAGRVFAQGSDALTTNGSGDIQLTAHFSTTNGIWLTTNTQFGVGVNVHGLITYDASNTTNDPIIYINGSPVAITETTAPVGGHVVTSVTMLVGNIITALNRVVDGDISEFAIWNRVLTPSEVTQVYQYRPSIVSSGLIVYMPLVSAVTDTQNSAPTVTGTAVQSHPVPIATNPGAQSGTEGESFTLDLSATDPNGGGLTWSLDATSDALPTGLSLAASTGIISGTPSVNGAFDLVIRATDTRGVYDYVSFTLTLAESEDTATDYYYYYSGRR